MQDKPLRFVARAEVLYGIGGHRRRRRDLGQDLTIRAAELKRAVRPSIELVALFMNGAVMTATEHGEIRERRGAALVVIQHDRDGRVVEVAARTRTIPESPPFRLGDSTPEFRSHLEGTTRSDRGGMDFFSREATPVASTGSCGPLGPDSRGAAETRPMRRRRLSSRNRRRHSAILEARR
jgi:hypothetical protein